MSDEMTVESLRWAIPRIAAKLTACADELNTLDGQLGDGDIGITMSAGMQAVTGKLDELPEDVGMSLLKCAQAFTSERASSYGTLLATGLMSAAKECKGRTGVGWNELGALLGGAIEAMSKRGRSELGQKTVLDALEAIRLAVDGQSDSQTVLELTDKALTTALDKFRDLPAKQGRARIFADRSVGLDDPGQVVIKRIVESLREDS